MLNFSKKTVPAKDLIFEDLYFDKLHDNFGRMVTHHMHLSQGPFGKIVNAEKTIETRLYDEKRQHINIGDDIEFVHTGDPSQKVLTKVKALYRYATFYELFSDFAPSYFGGTSKKELLEEIEKFYSKAKQQKYGVVGIKIEAEFS